MFRPKLLSIPDLQRILGAHRERFSHCIWPAWDRYYTGIAAEDRLTFDLGAEAKIINRYILAEIKREFSGIAGVEVLSQYDLLGIDGFPFGIAGSVVCRFKKLNNGGESSAYPTRRAQAIQRNDTEALDGIPEESTIVDVGPVINDLRSSFRDVQAIRVRDTRFIHELPKGCF